VRTEDNVLNHKRDYCKEQEIRVQRTRSKRASSSPVRWTSNKLWPASHIAATVATLNGAGVGTSSDVLHFVTPEGGLI